MNLSEFRSSFFDISNTADVCMLEMTPQQLTDEENLEQLDQDFVSLVDNYQARKVALNLSTVRYMTSSAIGKLIALHRRLTRNGGKLVLCCLQEDVIGILQTSHLLGYFTVTDNCTDAMAKFA